MLGLVVTVLLCLYLPVPFVMLWFHGLLPLWRRMGNRSYLLHAPLWIGLVVIVAALHPVWPAGAWEWPGWVRLVGVVVIAGCLALLAVTYRDIDLRTLFIVREVVPDEDRRLITGGVYGMVRHPRYAIIMAGSVGNALLSGYPLVAGSALVTVALSLVMTRMEERELLRYFGDDYREYASSVPAFIPRPFRRGIDKRSR